LTFLIHAYYAFYPPQVLQLPPWQLVQLPELVLVTVLPPLEKPNRLRHFSTLPPHAGQAGMGSERRHSLSNSVLHFLQRNS
jgi:hypothetical protein